MRDFRTSVRSATGGVEIVAAEEVLRAKSTILTAWLALGCDNIQDSDILDVREVVFDAYSALCRATQGKEATE